MVRAVFFHTSETTLLLHTSLRAFFVCTYAVQRRRQILSKLIVLRKTRSLHWYSGQNGVTKFLKF